MTQPQQKANDSIKKAAVMVVTGMLAQGNSGCLTVSTGGRPISLVKVTNSTRSTGEASYDIKRRSHELATMRNRLSINHEQQQMIDEVKMLPREVLIKELKFTLYIPPEQNLARKADFSLP
uniref:Uncharacterized protein n=1 Tax=Amphimedon queenslandica TaxID=400682 RepID=A0A1X7VSE0_AMPQE